MELNLEDRIVGELQLFISQLTQTIQNNNQDTNTCSTNAFMTKITYLSAESPMLKQIRLFADTVVKLDEVWAKLFLEERVCSPQKSIELGNHIYVFLHEIEQRVSHSQFHKKVYQQSKPILLQYIKALTLKFIHIFSESKEALAEKVRDLNSWGEKLKYSNKYMMFKVLKQLSAECNAKVREVASPLSISLDAESFDRIIQWIIQKHEQIQLKLKLQIPDWKIHKEEESTQLFQDRLTHFLDSYQDKQNTVTFVDAIREDGKRGLLVIEQSHHQLDEQFLVFSDEFGMFSVMNSALITYHWRSKALHGDVVPSTQIQKTQLEKILIRKEEIISEMRTAPTSVTKIYMEGVENAGDSLGKCLANFKNYDSINSFVKDFSKKTAIAGSISYMVLRMPLLGGLMIVGGFSYTLFNVLTNDYKNNQNKLADIGKLTIKTSASIGGGLIGATVGQALIPIPFVGAFFGGVIGGFLSTVGSNKAFSFLNSKKAQAIYKKLKQTINSDGSWDYRQELLNLFGLKEEYFQKSIGCGLGQQQREKVWMTALCFCMLSYYECRKDKLQMEEQMKSGNKEIKEELERIKQTGETETEGVESEFVSQDLDRTIIYLQSKHFSMRQHLPQLVSLLIKLIDVQ